MQTTTTASHNRSDVNVNKFVDLLSKLLAQVMQSFPECTHTASEIVRLSQMSTSDKTDLTFDYCAALRKPLSADINEGAVACIRRYVGNAEQATHLDAARCMRSEAAFPNWFPVLGTIDLHTKIVDELLDMDSKVLILKFIGRVNKSALAAVDITSLGTKVFDGALQEFQCAKQDAPGGGIREGFKRTIMWLLQSTAIADIVGTDVLAYVEKTEANDLLSDWFVCCTAPQCGESMTIYDACVRQDIDLLVQAAADASAFRADADTPLPLLYRIRWDDLREHMQEEYWHALVQLNIFSKACQFIPKSIETIINEEVDTLLAEVGHEGSVPCDLVSILSGASGRLASKMTDFDGRDMQRFSEFVQDHIQDVLPTLKNIPSLSEDALSPDQSMLIQGLMQSFGSS